MIFSTEIIFERLREKELKNSEYIFHGTYQQDHLSATSLIGDHRQEESENHNCCYRLNRWIQMVHSQISRL